MTAPQSENYPVLPIRDTVLFPGVTLPFRVGRKLSIAAVQYALRETDGWIVAITQKKNIKTKGDPTAEDLFRVGTLARIEKSRGNAEDGYQLVVRGDRRFRVGALSTASPGGSPGSLPGNFPRNFIEASGQTEADRVDADEATLAALMKSLKSLGQQILDLIPADTQQLSKLLEGIDDLGFLTQLCAANLEAPTAKKQELLENPSLRGRSLALLELMQSHLETLKVQGEIQEKMSNRMGKLQREVFLREQLKAIREELGEGSEQEKTDGYRDKIEAAGMPEDVKKIALDELKRLESMGGATGSPETHVIRTYLDWLCALPWNRSSSTEEIDLAYAKEVLEADHYGLDKIKKRIIQHLAVMKLKKNRHGSILCFVGPPGVGKTSLGASIARALGRKFVRGALGGVRDDAEIRGHRRTYIGALPGRIIQSIKRAGENNPVFMLDEIDKLARGFQGDPAAALLEVLDPEQNATFTDHYLDVPFDLSHVLFIATANSLETIPGPLLDRMEIIELNGYTAAEKLHIAKNHLVPKQLAEHGLSAEQVRFDDEALLRLITAYTREAGVRDLQRQIAAVCRSVTEKVVGNSAPVRVDLAALEAALGPERFVSEVAENVAMPGVVTGLAWTPVGGEILFIEASKMPGSGRLTITGQLGDVMKESAQIALSLVRSRLPALVPGFDFDKTDLHIHVPAGAIPKDGPSAGITMMTTIASLFSGKSVNAKLAMTGEITLRGAVMPVGGIKEKVIAAHRAGIEQVILSKRNQKDLRDVPEEVRGQLKFHLVETAAEVLRIALGLEAGDPSKNPTPDATSQARVPRPQAAAA